MLDIQNGIRSMTEFKQNSTAILKYIKKTHNPAVLTVNGRAEAVVIDAKTYQEMINKIALFESTKRIEAALKEMETDEGIPAEEVFKGLRKTIDQVAKKTGKKK